MKAIFLLLSILFIYPSRGAALTLNTSSYEKWLPVEIEAKIDLIYGILTSIPEIESAPEFIQLFGFPLRGETMMDWVRQRAFGFVLLKEKSLYASNLSGFEGMEQIIGLTKSFEKEEDLGFLLGIFIHELAHYDPETNSIHRHVPCPQNHHLTCDASSDGPFAFQSVFLTEIQKICPSEICDLLGGRDHLKMLAQKAKSKIIRK